MHKLQLNYAFHRLVISDSIQSILNSADNEQLRKFYRVEKCISKIRQKKKNIALEKVRDIQSSAFQFLGSKAAHYLAEVFATEDRQNLSELSQVLAYCSGMSGCMDGTPGLSLVEDPEIEAEPETLVAYGIAAVIYDDVAGATLLRAFDPDWDKEITRSIDLDQVTSFLAQGQISAVRVLNHVSIYLQANIARLSLYKSQSDSSRHGPARCLGM